MYQHETIDIMNTVQNTKYSEDITSTNTILEEHIYWIRLKETATY